MGMAPETPQTPTQANRLKRRLTLARALVLGSYGALLLVFTGLAVFGDTGNGRLWLVQVVPLLIFLPGLIRGRHRTYSWLCFVVLLYFTWSVTNTLSPFAYWRDYLVAGLSVILFIAAMMASRWRQQWWLWEQKTMAPRHDR